MKIKYLFLLPVIAAALTGCDDIEYSDAKPVENPQLPGITTSDFTVTPSSQIQAGLNLDALVSDAYNKPTNGEYLVPLYSVACSAELPEGAVISGGFEVAKEEDFANPLSLDNLVVNDGVVSAPLTEILMAHSAMFGRNPAPHTVYYRIPIYVTVDGAQYRIGDEGGNSYFCNGNSFQEVGVDPGFTVESTYYLLGTDGDTLVEFNHSENIDAYDDPVFTLDVKYNNPGTWQVVPASAAGSLNASQIYGPESPNAMSGKLVLGAQPGVISDPVKYSFSINMETLTYSIEVVNVPEWLATPNDSQGWDGGTSQHLALYDNNTFLGYAWFGGEWGGKIMTDAGIWCGIDSPMTYNEATGVWSGVLDVDGGGNINEGVGPELYFFNVNWDSLEIKMTTINSIGVVGSNNGWDADAPVALVPDNDRHLTWKGNVTFAAGDEFKFIANTGWGIELGGSLDNLVCDGGTNLPAPGAGTYTITLNLSTLPYSATIVPAE